MALAGFNNGHVGEDERSMNRGQKRYRMRRIYPALSLLSLASLGVEVLLTRMFDVIMWPNLSFLVISCAIFGLGVGGLYELLRPSHHDARRFVVPAFGFALTVWAIPLLLNAVPFSLDQVGPHPVQQLIWFLVLYLVLLAPFVFVGLCVCRIFSAWADDIGRLYAWDLAGAAIGAAAIIPLVQPFGPARLLVAASLLALLAAYLLAPSRRWRVGAVAVATTFILTPAVLGSRYVDLTLHDDKRGASREAAEGRLEFSAWDPVSQISVLDEPPTSGSPQDVGRKHIAYDGGTQTSNFFPFDGNFAALRANLPRRLMSQFWQRGVLAAHYARRDSGARVLIIGSAGGQETKAALMYGARDVDAVEMVGTVVDLATVRYADYIGHLFEQPGVHVHVGEGRTFLRASGHRYDIIQIFSNYTSSSVAGGSGAFNPAYLLTREAFNDYFAHLTPNGILQINHMYYPRIITTAASAWATVGGDDFRRHVAVFEKGPPVDDYLPTILIKHSAWSAAELDDLVQFFAFPAVGETPYWLAEDPVHLGRGFLPAWFYQAPLPARAVAEAPVNIRPVTDDQPFLESMRRSLRPIHEDRVSGIDRSTAWALNTQLHGGWFPRDWIHFIGGAIASLFYGVVFVLLPMSWSPIGRQTWRGKAATLSYFSLLGCAFITIELVLIQLLMKIIGYPLYTVATVLTAMLVGAAIGSTQSRRIATATGWPGPFIGIALAGLALIAALPEVSRLTLGEPMLMRVALAAAIILPLAFFLGMPFPMGIRALASKPRGAIAWAWSVNGLCTTAGAVASALLSLRLGFRATLLTALAAYVIAAMVFARLRRSNLALAGADAPHRTKVA